MDIKKLLKDAAVDKIASEFDFSDQKIDSIIDTVANAISGNKSNMGPKIVSDLKKKENLNDTLANKLKEMLLPIIMEAVAKNAGGSLSGMLGKFKL